MSRIERLVNLIAALSGAPTPVSYERIVRDVPGYEGRPESVRRQFERDKATLRDMGIELRTLPTDALAGGSAESVGYLIPADVTISDPGLTVPERAALSAATALVWGPDDGPGDGPGDAPGDATAAAVDAVPALAETLLDAVEQRRVVTFAYRSASAGSDGTRERRVEPWRLVHQSGRWYLIGRDVDAVERRTFRLDRFVGDVRLGGAGGYARPSEASDDHAVPVRGWEIGDDAPVTVRVAVRPDRVWWFLRETGGASGETAGRGAGDGDASAVDGFGDWPEVVVDVRDLDAFARFVLASLDSVVVTSPPAARTAVRGQLDRLAVVARGEVPT